MATEESKQFFCWGEIVREEKVCAEDLPNTSFFVIEKIIKMIRLIQANLYIKATQWNLNM
jgi:hypothetical protein